jgi:hypothetical protein
MADSLIDFCQNLYWWESLRLFLVKYPVWEPILQGFTVTLFSGQLNEDLG